MFTINVDKTQVEILEVNGLNGVVATLTENEGKYFVVIENNTKVDGAKDFVEIKYKTLVEGEVRISFKDFTIDEVLTVLVSDVVVESTAKAYDFTNFISLVNKINSDNVLSSYADIKAAIDEYKNIKDLDITDENALAAKTKLEKAISDYNNIVQLIDKADQASSKLEELLGGR